jgi:hypothetical protein
MYFSSHVYTWASKRLQLPKRHVFFWMYNDWHGSDMKWFYAEMEREAAVTISFRSAASKSFQIYL